MANLDSRSKRASSVNFLKPFTLDLALPDGAIGQGDKQHSVWDYSGILAASAAAAVIIACADVTVSLVVTATATVSLVVTATATVTECD